MFSSSRSLFFTLFLALTLLIAIAPTADANGNTVPAHRRQANRMLRKRAPLPASTDPSGGGLLPIGVGQDPDKVTDTSTSTSTSATAVTSSAATGKSTTSTSTTSSAVTSGVSAGIVDALESNISSDFLLLLGYNNIDNIEHYEHVNVVDNSG